MSCRHVQRRGFTILDVMVALVIASVAVLIGRQMLLQLALSDRRLDAATRREAQARNTSRQVRDMLSRLEVGTDSTRVFSGETTRADFTTWCEVPRGWLERCGASLVVDTLVHPSPLFLATTRGDTLMLKRSAEGTVFRYMTDPEDANTWLFWWGRGITAPVAIAIVTPFDTTLIRIGPRG